jgi:small subunit ribosomal protein S9
MTKEKYFEAVGRRKTATARVRFTPGGKKTTLVVNDRKFDEYFKTEVQRMNALAAAEGHVLDITALVSGGGASSQADAIRLGVARALLKMDISLRGDLKKKGFLTRDSRAVERKKFGLKKARRSPQWSKR